MVRRFPFKALIFNILTFWGFGLATSKDEFSTWIKIIERKAALQNVKILFLVKLNVSDHFVLSLVRHEPWLCQE